MMITAFYILVAAVSVANLISTLRRYLMMFQQNSYRASRFRHWMSESGESTTFANLFGILIVLAWGVLPSKASMFLCGAFSLWSYIYLLTRKYKKPLTMTPRAWRILVTAVFIAVIATGVIDFFVDGYMEMLEMTSFSMMLWYCISRHIIIAANWLLKPVERHITGRYLKDAKSILASMPTLKIIGITGSYGKTTTKHYLQRILSEKYETLMTPGSYNTPMGVVRTVRELLKPYHEVFIVEMGAKQKGDIAEICDIVHPHDGIITAVGPQHLESFGNIKNVQATKFELADSLPSDGIILINNDFEMIANREVTNCRCIRYAIKNTEKADFVAYDIKYAPEGSRFTIRRNSDGHTLQLETRLLGECNVSNLLAASAMAIEMGVPDESIRYAVSQILPVEHRLSIKRVPGGATILDDAFNSNPVGSAMALDVLASMTGGKRILVTPGMIELGEEQYNLNKNFGEKAASSCDIVLVVGKYNRDAILSGLKDAGMDEKLVHTPDTFAEAQQILKTIMSAGDIVLYENDLPDTFK